jgi:two-component system nitrate/nitrite response regulator NarL
MLAYRPATSASEGQIGSFTRSLTLILRYLMEGPPNKVIALKLVMTESTVKVHIKSILRKLRLQNRTQAAPWARDHARK